MAPHVFVVVPYAGKWAVSAEGEVLAVTRSKAAAEDLARKAGAALRHRESSTPSGEIRIHERRSFLED